MKRLICALLIVLSPIGVILSNAQDPDTLKISQTSETITVDGQENETIWQTLDSVFVTKVEPGFAPPDNPDDFTASFKTNAPS